MSWSLDGRILSSVLVTRLRYLGDIVMSTVVAEALREGDPDLDIGYLCEENHAAVLENQPDIARVHRLRAGRRGADAKARAGAGLGDPLAKGTAGMIRELRRCGYDLAVDLFFNPRSAWLLKLAGIPLRIGGTRKTRGRLYTHRVLRSDLRDPSSDFDGVAPGGLGEHLCRLAPLVHVESGLPFFARLAPRYRQGQLMPKVGQRPMGPETLRLMKALGVDPARPFLLLAPNATWPTKEWSAARWRELALLLVREFPWPVVLLEAPGRRDKWDGVAGAIPPARGGVLAPLRLPEALAVAGAAKVLVTVDGGLMHAAVALGTPTLALFGPTDPRIWFPYEGGGPYRVLATAPHCHPCDLHECPEFICMPELSADRVVAEVSRLRESSTDVSEVES